MRVGPVRLDIPTNRPRTNRFLLNSGKCAGREPQVSTIRASGPRNYIHVMRSS